MIELVDPADGSIHAVTVIGILDETIGSLFGLYAAQPTMDAIYHGTAATSRFVTLEDSGQAANVSREIESALLSHGVAGVSIHDELEAEQAQENGFLYIIQGFMGRGLLVGIAAVGVIAFRSGVEKPDRRIFEHALDALGIPEPNWGRSRWSATTSPGISGAPTRSAWSASGWSGTSATRW